MYWRSRSSFFCRLQRLPRLQWTWQAIDSKVVNALRLMELTDCTSAVVKSLVADTLKYTDPHC